MIEIARASRFFEGLFDDLRMGCKGYTSLDELYNKALEHEQIFDGIVSKRKVEAANQGGHFSKFKKPKPFVRRPFAGSGGSSSFKGKPTVWECKVFGKDHRGKTVLVKWFAIGVRKRDISLLIVWEFFGWAPN